MTEDIIGLRELTDKSADADLLREMIGCGAQMSMARGISPIMAK